MTGFLNDDGSLILAEWAEPLHGLGSNTNGVLAVPNGPLPSPMYGTKATGKSLVSNGQLGVDLIRVPAGAGFAPHTHPGDHLLICVAGEGTITYEGKIYPTRAGQVYLIEGAVPHAVGAVTDHVILAVGSPHRAVDAADRMTLTAYAAVAADMGHLHCLACGKTGTAMMLTGWGCTHTPVEPGTGKLLVVGIAPASQAHIDLPAFAKTRSGTRLARLLDVDPDSLTERVDTINVFDRPLADWQKVDDVEWSRAGARLAPMLAGRVVIACGKRVAGAATGSQQYQSWGSVVLTRHMPTAALVVTIPHPSGLSRLWNNPVVHEAATKALGVAATLAATGPPTGSWTLADRAALEAITRPAFSSVEP